MEANFVLLVKAFSADAVSANGRTVSAGRQIVKYVCLKRLVFWLIIRQGVNVMLRPGSNGNKRAMTPNFFISPPPLPHEGQLENQIFLRTNSAVWMLYGNVFSLPLDAREKADDYYVHLCSAL